MKRLLLSTILTLFLGIILINCSSEPDNIPAVAGDNPVVIFLVRHGEKVDHSADAQLSGPGLERSKVLATILRSAEIDYVHSSNFSRTRDTASPTATGQKLEVELYDHKNLPALVEKIHRKGGRHLVVGHSTTTPEMVRLLGEDPGPGQFGRGQARRHHRR